MLKLCKSLCHSRNACVYWYELWMWANIIVQIQFVESATCLDELAQEYGFDVSSVERLTDKLVYMHTLHLNNTADLVMRCCDMVTLETYSFPDHALCVLLIVHYCTAAGHQVFKTVPSLGCWDANSRIDDSTGMQNPRPSRIRGHSTPPQIGLSLLLPLRNTWSGSLSVFLFIQLLLPTFCLSPWAFHSCLLLWLCSNSDTHACLCQWTWLFGMFTYSSKLASLCITIIYIVLAHCLASATLTLSLTHMRKPSHPCNSVCYTVWINEQTYTHTHGLTDFAQLITVTLYLCIVRVRVNEGDQCWWCQLTSKWISIVISGWCWCLWEHTLFWEVNEEKVVFLFRMFGCPCDFTVRPKSPDGMLFPWMER